MNKLLAISIASASIAIGAIPALAEVDPKIHKLCIEAKDYLGCVSAMKGETTTTSRVINSQGADMAEGNQCPQGYAYLGGGNCREVQCRYGKSATGGHDPRLAGKTVSWRDKDLWYCKTHLIYRGSLRFTDSEMRATNNPNCPPGEPRLGYNSTCDTQESSSDFSDPAWSLVDPHYLKSK